MEIANAKRKFVEESKLRGDPSAKCESCLQTLCSLTSRLRFIKCYVWSKLLYDIDTWNISTYKPLKCQIEMANSQNKLDKTYHIEEVLKDTGSKRLLFDTFRTREIAFFGHITKRDSCQRDLIDCIAEENKEEVD